jgi:hypothetical protein
MNAVIHKHGSDEIRFFVRDCVRQGKRGTDYWGTNAKVGGIKSHHWSIVWTEDDANEILDADGAKIGWDKVVSEITPSANPPVEKETITPQEYSEAFKVRQLLDKMTYQDVEDHIENNITDLPSAKVFLKRLSKVTLALAKIIDKEYR